MKMDSDLIIEDNKKYCYVIVIIVKMIILHIKILI
jgi:hypothetical protein